MEGGNKHAAEVAATEGMEMTVPPPPPFTEDQPPIARNAKLPILRRRAPPAAQTNISGSIATSNSNLSSGTQNASSDDDSIKIEISLDGSGAIAHLTPKTSRSNLPPNPMEGSDTIQYCAVATATATATAKKKQKMAKKT